MSHKPIILIGGGGHAVSLLEMLDGMKYMVAGYTDPQPHTDMPVPWLGSDRDMRRDYSPDDYYLHCALVYHGKASMAWRAGILAGFAGYHFATLISPTAIVTPHAAIGEGSAVMHGAIINDATVGANCIINTGAVVEHGCAIGSNTFIGPRATIGGGVSIGADCFLGLGCMVRNGVSIAPGTTIGMGAVVTETITEPGTYVGCPAKRIVAP